MDQCETNENTQLAITTKGFSAVCSVRLILAIYLNKKLASRVQDLVSKSIELTFAYRDLDLLIKGTDRNTKSGLNKIEEQIYQAKKQLLKNYYYH